VAEAVRAHPDMSWMRSLSNARLDSAEDSLPLTAEDHSPGCVLRSHPRIPLLRMPILRRRTVGVLTVITTMAAAGALAVASGVVTRSAAGGTPA